MSLTVSGLSKKYHNKTANRDVSFEIGNARLFIISPVN